MKQLNFNLENTPIKLFKKTPDAKIYHGRYAGLEFTSTGEPPKT